MRTLLAVFVVLAVAWSQFAGQSTAADRYGLATRPLESIKFDPDEGLVLIPVRIGARLSICARHRVYRQCAQRRFRDPAWDLASIPCARKPPMAAWSKWTFTIRPDARVGSLPLTKRPVACHDFTSIREASGCAAYGIAGLDFFEDRIVTIDFDAGHVDVLPPDTERDPMWGESVPLMVDEKGSMRILAKLGEKVDVPFVVDTGNSITGDLSEATLTHLTDLHDVRVTGTTDCLTISGTHSLRVARVSTCRSGLFRHENLRFTSAQQNLLGTQILFSLPPHDRRAEPAALFGQREALCRS